MKNFRCLLCGGRASRPVAPALRDDAARRVVACVRCSLISAHPLPSPAEERAFYDKDGQGTGAHFPRRISALRAKTAFDTARHTKFIARLLPRGSRVLDVGSGFGFLLAELSARGMQAVGVDISAYRRSVSRLVTASPVYAADITARRVPGAPYDALTLYHVLEHLARPVHFLRKLRSLLRPGGLLIIEVPNAADRLLKKNAAYRAWYWQRAHLSYFTQKTLADTLKRAGWRSAAFIYDQRYGKKNAAHWMKKNRPDFGTPAYLGLGDAAYARALARRHASDTLIAVARR